MKHEVPTWRSGQDVVRRERHESRHPVALDGRPGGSLGSEGHQRRHLQRLPRPDSVHDRRDQLGQPPGGQRDAHVTRHQTPPTPPRRQTQRTTHPHVRRLWKAFRHERRPPSATTKRKSSSDKSKTSNTTSGVLTKSASNADYRPSRGAMGRFQVNRDSCQKQPERTLNNVNSP